MSLDTYTEPVAKLLTFGNCKEMDLKNWVDYVEQVGLTDADIPELIRMATDPHLWEQEGEGLEIWAPIHAWRSLGQLHAETAIQPLLELFKLQDDNDWVSIELPDVFAMIGAVAVQPLTDFLADNTLSEWARMYTTDSLKAIAEAHPDSRQACVDALTKQLEFYAENGEELNGGIINNLIDLKAVEAAPVIEKAFTAEAVDDFFTGTWANVQVDLGLKAEADFSQAELTPKMPPQMEALQKVIDMIPTLTANSTKPAPKGFSKPNLEAAKSTKKTNATKKNKKK
jgi:Protein of unknown function (DUF1186)